MEFIRHGDVLLEKITGKNIKFQKAKDLVLAEGEVTGHKHVLMGDLLFAEQDGEKFIQLESDSKLTHQEHDTLNVPKGTYKVKLQREVNLQEETRQVMD